MLITRFPICIKCCLLVMLSIAMSHSADTTAAAFVDIEFGSADSAPAFISMAGNCRYPAVASEGTHLYLTWIVVEGRHTNIYFRRSADDGKNWLPPSRISTEEADCYPPTIAVDSGIVHLAWIDYAESVDGELYYTRSTDGGETWEKNRILITDANSSRYPLLACNGRNVYLVWQDVASKVYFKASRDKGLTWEKEIILISGKGGKHSCYCYPPTIAARGDELAVVWSDFGEDKKGVRIGINWVGLWKSNKDMVSSVVLRTSSDNGRTWGTPRILSEYKVAKETVDEIDNPTILLHGDDLCVFWLDKRNIQLGELFFARFNPKKGKFYVKDKRLFPMEKRSPKRPSAVLDKEGNIHFAWASYFSGKSFIAYSMIDRDGNAHNGKKNLTSTEGSFYNPVISRTSSGRLFVLWFDQPGDQTEWSRIFLKTSSNNGTSWEYWGTQTKETEER